MEKALFKDITLDLLHRTHPDVIAVSKDTLRGWLVLPLVDGKQLNAVGYNVQLWTFSEGDAAPQFSVGEVDINGYLVCPVAASMLRGSRVAMQVKLLKGSDAVRFPAFRVMVEDAIDDSTGTTGETQQSLWERLMKEITTAATECKTARQETLAARDAAVVAKTAAEAARASLLADYLNATSSTIEQATAAAVAANTAATNANAKAELANSKATQANTAAQLADISATNADTKATKAEQAATQVASVLQGALATPTAKGLMSAADKTKLDGLEKTIIVNDLTTGGNVVALSAEQGKVLKQAIDNKPNTPVVDNLSSTSVTSALSANQGKILSTKVGELSTLKTTAKTSTVEAVNELYDSTLSTVSAGQDEFFQLSVTGNNTSSAMKRGGLVMVSLALTGLSSISTTSMMTLGTVQLAFRPSLPVNNLVAVNSKLIQIRIGTDGVLTARAAEAGATALVGTLTYF